MDKYLIRLKELDDSPITPPQPIILGVLGSSSIKFWTKETISENLMNPVLEEIPRTPDSILLPSEGTTSLLLQVYFEKKNVKVSVFDADWQKLGRQARSLRDSRIIKESTHLLLFLGLRSDFYEKIAIREAKKGKNVFTVDPKTNEIVQWSS